MKKWLKTVIILAAIIILVVGGVLGYRAYKSSKELKEKYDVTPSLSQTSVNDIGSYISSSGNITASKEVKVNTEAYGEVASVIGYEGQKVKAGDVLAEIDAQTLMDDIETLEDEIFAKQVEIETSTFSDIRYYIKSPINGEVKDIKVEEDDKDTEDVDEASDIAEVMEEYGYLCFVSPDDVMYVVTEETADFLKVGAEVKVSRYDYEYDGVVEKIEDGKTYILVDTDNIALGRSVNIYADGSNEKIKGTAELYEWVEIIPPVAEGRISSVSVYTHEYVEIGDVLFTYKARSQEMIDLYNELEDLKAQLAEKQEMLNGLDVVSPVDGIITAVSLEEGTDVEQDTLAFTIADTSVWVVTVGIDELDINQIKLGMKAAVTIDAYEGESFEGVVAVISSVGTASSGVTSYDVDIEVQDNELFKMNMTANAEIEIQFIENALSVPVEAVREVNGRSFVVVYTNPTEEEVEAAKKQMIESEKNASTAVSSFSDMSDEDMAELREKAQEMRESGEMPEDGGDRGSGQLSEDAGVQNFAGGFSNMAIVSQLSIADRLYGEAVEVEVGLINETYAQILSGLSEGDIVILPDTSSSTSTSTAQVEEFDRGGIVPGMDGGFSGGGGFR